MADADASNGRHGLAARAPGLEARPGGQAVLRSARSAMGGFTLVEVLLAMALLLIFGTVIVVSYSGWLRGSQMDEGIVRFQTLLRMARAEAANQGRRFRLNFDQDTHAPIVEWEADPLTTPGKFTPFQPGSWETLTSAELVTVKSCQLTGPSAYLTLSSVMSSAEEPQDWQPITFYPDGSSDSATVTLTSVTPDDDQRLAVVQLNGLTGTVPPALVMMPDAYEQYLEDASQEEVPPPNLSASAEESSAASTTPASGGAGQ